MTSPNARFYEAIDNIAHAPAAYNETTVRERIVLPILHKLGYPDNSIIRDHGFPLQVGSKKTTIFPDYILTIGNFNAWVLEVKAPTKQIDDLDIIDQAFSYASHREIRSTYFALCNGVEFALYKNDINRTLIYRLCLADWESKGLELKRLLSPKRFQAGERPYKKRKTQTFDYLNRPLLGEIPVHKQARSWHFGVHGYFTKQSWDVVQSYITNFTKEGDVVLDPFGGSGVTAIEAMMTHRKAIHVDINPMANFLVETLIAPVNDVLLSKAFKQVTKEFQYREPKTDKAIDKILQTLPGPKPLPLPESADVDTADKLFSPEQTAHLALLKSIILKQKDENIRKSLMLMFSGLVTVTNLTYHISTAVTANTGFGGNAAPFVYYRYRMADTPTPNDFMQAFEYRFNRVKKAKAEMEKLITPNTIANMQIVKGTATDLSFLAGESVDYIYTDPPYGKKIPYLDLSAMWNAWLDLDVTESDYALEAIEGGEHRKSKREYNNLIARSIKEMYRVLKFDRWLSFVFAHKDPEFWHLIIDTAEACGFEYVGAVPQKNGQTSFKKRQHPFTVLSGQLIINFRKVKDPKVILKSNALSDIDDIIHETVERTIAENYGAALEQINDALIVRGLELGILDLMKEKYEDITPFLLAHFIYNEAKGTFYLKKNVKGKLFRHKINLFVQIDYCLTMLLREREHAEEPAHYDEINQRIMTELEVPDNVSSTIDEVLESRCTRHGEGAWKLKPEENNLFR